MVRSSDMQARAELCLAAQEQERPQACRNFGELEASISKGIPMLPAAEQSNREQQHQLE